MTNQQKRTLELDQRQSRILRFIVDQYVLHGTPVGSRTLSKGGGEHLSPASIRNTMADLEEMGLVTQPHTSAGRVPTDLGFRYFVDELMPPSTIPLAHQNEIDDFFDNFSGLFSSLFQQASRLLSRYSHYIGISSTPQVESLVFKHVQFLRQGPGSVLVVFVGSNNIVRNKLISVKGDFAQEQLDRAGNWLNEHFAGLPLSRVKERISERIVQEQARYDLLVKHALELSREAFKEGFGTERVFVEGAPNIIRDPDLASQEQMESILTAIEEKTALLSLIDRIIDAEGVQVIIGSETNLREIEGCSIVAGAYQLPDGSSGRVAILGPKRMHYPRNIYLVDYISRRMSKVTE